MNGFTKTLYEVIRFTIFVSVIKLSLFHVNYSIIFLHCTLNTERTSQFTVCRSESVWRIESGDYGN